MSKNYYLGPKVKDDEWEDVLSELVPGSNVMIWCDRLEYPRLCCEVEDQGLEIRDCLTVIAPDQTLMILWAMVPVAGTFAANALEHGVAGLNINAGRISISGVRQATAGTRTVKWGVQEGGCSYVKGTGATFTTEGRFPANFILMHHPECECVGTKKVKSHNPDNKQLSRKEDVTVAYGKFTSRSTVGYADEDGTEEVADWNCDPACPVSQLDLMTMDKIHSAGSQKPATQYGETEAGSVLNFGTHGLGGARFGDSGGASRFFKQVQNFDDLKSYLESMLIMPSILEREEE